MWLLSKGETARSVNQQLQGIVDSLYGLYQVTDRSAWHPLDPAAPPLSAAELEQAVIEFAAVELPDDA